MKQAPGKPSLLHALSFHLSRLFPTIHANCPAFLTDKDDPLSLFHQLSDTDIQDYHDTYRPRMGEMHAFNMVSPSFIFPEMKKD